MTYMQAVAVAVLLAAGPGSLPAAAQTGFTGTITFAQHNSDGKVTTFVQTTKGRKVRLEGMSQNGSAMILDGDAKVMKMVEPKDKRVMIMTEEDAKQMATMMGPMAEQMKQKHPAPEPGRFKFTDTGRKETVAGVSCEVWHGTYSNPKDNEEDRDGEACLANGVGLALAEMTFANPMMQRGQYGWDRMQQYRELVGGNKGILKVVRFKDGKPSTELEALKIEPATPSDTMFQSPPGYTEVRMGDMMRQAREAMEKMKAKQEQKK